VALKSYRKALSQPQAYVSEASPVGNNDHGVYLSGQLERGEQQVYRT